MSDPNDTTQQYFQEMETLASSAPHEALRKEQLLCEVLLERELVDREVVVGCWAELDRIERAAEPRPQLLQLLFQRRHLASEAIGDLLQEVERRFAETSRPGPPADDPGETLGRYRVIREVARGGMGVVLEAEDPELRRRVAIKVLQQNIFGGEMEIARLKREARTAGSLNHPNIIAIHELGAEPEPDGGTLHFIVMDYIEGPTLDEVLRQMGRDQRLEVLEKVARAVGHAHQSGVIHRDLKPSNIMMDGDRPIVTDFGLARSASAESQLTTSGAVMGTPHYMAPEQVEGRIDKIDARSDVWALGVLMYQMLLDVRPFRGGSVVELFNRIVNEDPVLTPGTNLPRDLVAVCLKALQKAPVDRYPNAAALADELRRWSSGEPIEARPPAWSSRLRRQIRRRPVFLAFLLLLLAVGLVAGGYGWQRQRLTRRFEALARQAREAHRARKWTIALGLCERALEIRPEDQALRRLSVEIRDRLQAPLRLREQEKLLARAKRRLERGDDGKALADCERAVAMSETAEALELRAWARLAASDVDGALRDATRALALDDGRAIAVAVLGKVRSRKGDREAEAKALDRALRLDPRAGVCWYWRGMLRSAREQYPGAVSDLTRAIDLQVRFPRVHGRRAWAYWKAGKIRQAIQDLDTQIALTPDHVSAYEHRADLRFQTGNFRGSLADYDAAIRLAPKGWYYAMRGKCQMRLANPDQAIEECQQAIRFDRTTLLAYAVMARAFRQKKQPAAARRILDKGIALGPRDLGLRIERAEVRAALGELKGALADLNQALALRPTWGPAYAFRGRVHEALGDQPSADADYGRAYRHGPRDWQVLYRWALALTRQGKRAEGLELLGKAHDLAPEAQKPALRQLIEKTRRGN